MDLKDFKNELLKNPEFRKEYFKHKYSINPLVQIIILLIVSTLIYLIFR